MAEIHAQLTADCHYLGRFPLCHLLLSNDSNFPWFILVPDREAVREIYQLDPDDRQQLLKESCDFSEFLQNEFSPDKLNVAALGNQVPQLHLHHIARYQTDAAWPGPIWGKVAPNPYTEAGLLEVRQKLSQSRLPDFRADENG